VARRVTGAPASPICSGSGATAPNLSYAQSKLADLMLFQHLAALTTAHHHWQAGADGEGEQALAHVIGDLAHRDC
jgi:hypothetical protein